MGAEAVANQRCQPASGPARMGAEAGSHRDGDAAIRALGPLFRITDVFLWDNASSGISKSSTCHDSSPQEYSADYVNSAVSCSNVDSVVDDATSEDLELARQMDALGLPTSFKTNKEHRRNTCTGEKRKGVAKSTSVHKVTGIKVPEISTLAEVDGLPSQISSFSSITTHTCAAGRAENVASHYNTDDTFNKDIQLDGEPNNEDAVILGRLVKEQVCSEVIDVVKADSTMDYPSTITTENNNEDDMKSVDFRSSNLEGNEVNNIDHLCFQGEKLRYGLGRGINLEYASSLCHAIESEETSIDSNLTECSSHSSRFENGIEWGIFWDAFYMRNYYYNFRTQESTWYPPSGLEQAGFLAMSSEINTDVTEEGAYLAFVWNYNNHEHSAKVTSPITEGHNDGELSVRASDEFMSRVDPANEILTSDVHLTLLGGSSNNFVEYVEHTNSSKTSSSADNFGEAPFCPSDTLDQVDRVWQMAEAAGLIRGFQMVRRGMLISHLQYADDTILFLDNGDQFPPMVRLLLELLEEVIGLKVNFLKTFLVGVNVQNLALQRAASFLGCKIGRLPFSYLGLPLTPKSRRCSD